MPQEGQDAGSGVLSDGDVVALVAPDGDALYVVDDEGEGAAQGTRHVLRAKRPGECEEWNGADDTIVKEKRAHMQVVGAEESDRQQQEEREEGETKRVVGLRGLTAQGRFLQACRKGKDKLRFRSAGMGVYERWEVEEQAGPEGDRVKLRSAMLRGKELDVRARRLGRVEAEAGSRDGPHSGALMEVDAEVNKQPTVLHQVSNLILEEWRAALEKEVGARRDLEARLSQLTEQKERAVAFLASQSGRLKELLNGLRDEVSLRRALLAWKAYLRSGRRRREKALWRLARARQGSAFSAWCECTEEAKVAAATSRKLARNRASRCLAAWLDDTRTTSILLSSEKRLVASRSERLVSESWLRWWATLVEGRKARTISRRRRSRLISACLDALYEHAYTSKEAQACLSRASAAGTWRTASLALRSWAERIRGADRFAKAARMRFGIRRWRDAAQEDAVARAGKRKVAERRRWAAFSAWRSVAEWKGAARDEAEDMAKRNEGHLVRVCLDEMARVAAEKRMAREAADSAAREKVDSLARASLRALRENVQRQREERRALGAARAKAWRGTLRAALDGWSAVARSEARARLLERRALERVSSRRRASAFRAWFGAASREMDLKRRLRVGMRKLAELHARVSFEVWADSVERGASERRAMSKAAARLGTLRLSSSFGRWLAETEASRGAMELAERRRRRSLLVRAWRSWGRRQTLALATDPRRVEVKVARLRLGNAANAWRGVVAEASERRKEAEEVRLRGWRRLGARALRGWSRVVAVIEEGRLEAEARERAGARSALRDALDGWREAVKGARERERIVERNVKARLVARNHFLQWYWDAFSGEIQEALATMTGDADATMRSYYGAIQGPAQDLSFSIVPD